MFGEFTLTGQYVGVSVLLSVGLWVPCHFGKICPNFIQLLHKTKGFFFHKTIQLTQPQQKPDAFAGSTPYLKLNFKASVVIFSKFQAMESELL